MEIKPLSVQPKLQYIFSRQLTPAFVYCSAHSDPGTPQSGPGTPHSDAEASGRENQSDDEKWEGGAKSDQSDDEERKRHYSDEDRENSDDEGPRGRKPGNPHPLL